MKLCRRATAWLLISVILLACFSSCSGVDEDDSSKVTGNAGSVTDPVENSETGIQNATDAIKSFKQTDYDGATFSIWASNVVVAGNIVIQQVPGDTETGERINDALITRDNLVEDYYKISIEYNLIEPETSTELYDRASKSILSNESVVDLMLCNMCQNAKNFVNESLTYDMNDVNAIDLSQPWWHQQALEDLKINGHVYLATGDITPRYVYSPYTILFNKKLFDQYQIDYPYDMVREGTWTMDELEKIIKNTYQDLNNNGAIDINDFYGYAMDGEFYQYYNAFGETAMKIENDEAVINCTSEAAMNKLISIAEFFEDQTIWRNSGLYDHVEIFTADRALMTPQTACNYMLFVDMNSDFGVLPCPKYDVTQESYHAWVNPWIATAAMIPKTVADISRTGQITESLAAVGRYTVTPAAYEVTLLTRQLRDEDSVEMLKIAAEGSMYDLAAFFGWGNFTGSLSTELGKGSGSIASMIESKSKVAIKAAQKTLAAVEK